MSLERAIHDRWHTYRPLAALISPEKVFTGRQFGSPALPYAVIHRGENREALRTSGGFLYQRTPFVVTIYSESLETAKAVESEVRSRFDRRDFPFEGGYCLDLRWTGQSESLGDDGVWTLSIQYLAMNETAAAA